MKSPGSLFARLLLSGALWALPLLAAAAVGLSTVYRAAVYSNLDDELSAVVTALIGNAEVEPDGRVTTPPFADPRFDGVFSGRYWQIDIALDEEPAARSESLWDQQLELPDATRAELRANPGARRTLVAPGPNGESLRVVAESIYLSPDMAEPAVIAAAADRSPAERAVRRFTFAAAWMLAAFAAVLILALIFQTRMGLAPLVRLRNAVADVREGRVERLPGGYPVEIAPLADEMNSLIGHNREVVERARTHAGNLAHALKTPIAVLLNESRGRPDDYGRLVLRQAETMAQQVDHHLRRARAAARGRASGARTPVGPVVSDIARTVTRIYRDRSLDVVADCPEGLVFHGERQDLEEMVGNLLDNAGKWAARRVRASVVALPGQALEIRIDDDGPGLPADRRAEAMQRGARLDEAAPGSGLGLAIVSDLAEAYGGSLALEDAPMGGLRAALRLPGVA